MAFEKFSKFLVKIFGSRNERLVNAYMQTALQACELESSIQALDDEALKAKTSEFKSRIAQGTHPEEIMVEAFAVVRETALRNVEMRHFDVQLVGGNVLYEGNIAEMATGEGKTLVATLAAYLVHLTGRKVHVVTVNDYLAKRDAEWMTPVFSALGLTVGAIQADMDTSAQERKDQYNCDITYGTNNEFGFDYLRDNMKISMEQMAQGPLEYAIIDEVDSILIDEARTPLIISGPAFEDVTCYKKADGACRQLIKLQENFTRLEKQIDSAKKRIANANGELDKAKDAKDNNRIQKAQKVIEQTEEELRRAELAKEKELEGTEKQIEESTLYYHKDIERKSVTLMEMGDKTAEKLLGLNLHTYQGEQWRHRMEQALRAHLTFEKEKSYVVMEGKIVIVDEFTGRLMHGRQWSDGLHQAIEAKEGVKVKEETQTLATITLQNFFRLYGQIAGMTGTAETEAGEFLSIYDLDVVIIPTDKPCIRDDRDDMIYKTMREKFMAIVDNIFETSKAGRPVLVGTISIEKSEAISAVLTKKYGLDHEVLNAKQHQREATIVLKAGHQHKGRDGNMWGNVTIATNMAGRGTDIKLGEGVLYEVISVEDDPSEKGVEKYTIKQNVTGKEISFRSTDPLAEIFHIEDGQKWVGGLHIVGTERHEARRIDNQLRGRAGRQGDAGSSGFFLSFEDDLLSNFAPEWTVKALSWIGWEEGQSIYHPRISKGIEKAQKKVEERNYEIRKSLLEYDEVMDYQRKGFYSRRRHILRGKGLKSLIEEMIEAMIDGSCENILSHEYTYHCIIEWARGGFGVDLQVNRITGTKPNEIVDLIKDQTKSNIDNEISLSIGEYLEDFDDPKTWNIDGLCRWAMSAFGAGLSASKLRHATHEEIEKMLLNAAHDQIDKKDYSQLDEFLKDDFSLRTFVQWAYAKFDVKINLPELKDLKPDEIRRKLTDAVADKYKQREIEYPVEFALNMVYGPQGVNIYGFEALANWAKDKYDLQLSSEQFQEMSPQNLRDKLLEISKSYWGPEGQLAKQLDDKIATLDERSLIQWASERFEANLEESDHGDENIAELLHTAAAEYLRKELSDLEKYVLLQIYDSGWKDHLYAMDHLKESIFLRAFAEKDPKTEYKHEGHRMFNEMLETIEDRVTSTVFKVHLQAGAPRQKSVWNVSQTKHDEVDQFAMAQRQRAAAIAPQGEMKVKQIKLDQPKVGRNDPCTCGSGKKYKKCCGRNV